MVHLFFRIARQLLYPIAHKCVAPGGEIDLIGDAPRSRDGLAVDAFCLGQFVLGFFEFGDVPAQANHPKDLTVSVYQGDFAGMGPGDFAVGIDCPFNSAQNRLTRAHDRLVIGKVFIGKFGREEIEVGLADQFALVGRTHQLLGLAIGSQKDRIGILYIYVFRQVVDDRAQQIALGLCLYAGLAQGLFQLVLFGKISGKKENSRAIL